MRMLGMVVVAPVDLKLSFSFCNLSSLTSLHTGISNPENINSARYICQQ